MSKYSIQSKINKLSITVASRCQEFSTILLFAPRFYSPGEYITKTDGKTIKIGDNFFKLPIKYQIYHLLHTSLHLALRHHHRAKEIQGNELAVQIWNLSADVVINEIILPYLRDKLSYSYSHQVDEENPLQQPMYDLSDLEHMLSATDGLKDDNNQIPSAEKLYLYIIKSIDKKEIDPESLPTVPQDIEPTEFKESDKVLSGNGLGNEAGKSNDSKISDMLWNNRLESTFKQFGDGVGSSLMGLLNHLYKPKTPWDKILRTYLNNRLSSEREPDYKRPSRRNLAGITNIFEPNRQKKKGIKSLVVCLDTSGSCWNSTTQSKFISNIDVVKNQAQCNVTLITFDSDVHECISIPLNQSLADAINNSNISLSGGGGTSFIPPLEKAKEYNPDVCVFFTDCYGPFPDVAPNYPTIWATIGNTPPFGKNIQVEEEEEE